MFRCLVAENISFSLAFKDLMINLKKFFQQPLSRALRRRFWKWNTTFENNSNEKKPKKFMLKYRNNKPFTKTVSPQRTDRKHRFNSINFQITYPSFETVPLKRARQTCKKKPQLNFSKKRNFLDWRWCEGKKYFFASLKRQYREMVFWSIKSLLIWKERI
jgi:hypothetical protein